MITPSFSCFTSPRFGLLMILMFDRWSVFILLPNYDPASVACQSPDGGKHRRRGHERRGERSRTHTNAGHRVLVLQIAAAFSVAYCFYLLELQSRAVQATAARSRRMRTSIPMRRNSRPWLACSGSWRANLVHYLLRTRTPHAGPRVHAKLKN